MSGLCPTFAVALTHSVGVATIATWFQTLTAGFLTLMAGFSTGTPGFPASGWVLTPNCAVPAVVGFQTLLRGVEQANWGATASIPRLPRLEVVEIH
jgi:hypothetical protein